MKILFSLCIENGLHVIEVSTRTASLKPPLARFFSLGLKNNFTRSRLSCMPRQDWYCCDFPQAPLIDLENG